MGAFKNLPMQNMEILSPNHPFEEENHLPNQQFFFGCDRWISPASGGSEVFYHHRQRGEFFDRVFGVGIHGFLEICSGFIIRK